MEMSRSEELTRRVARLERDARWWRLAAVSTGGLLALVALVGATPPQAAPIADEIRARRFVLVDQAGREQAYLGMGVVGTAVRSLEPELCLGDREKSGTCVYPYGLSTRASHNGFVNLNPMGLRMTLGTVKVVINTGMGIAGPALVLKGPSPASVLVDEKGHVLDAFGDALAAAAAVVE